MVFDYRKIRSRSIHRWIRLVILRRMIYNTTHFENRHFSDGFILSGRARGRARSDAFLTMSPIQIDIELSIPRYTENFGL